MRFGASLLLQIFCWLVGWSVGWSVGGGLNFGFKLQRILIREQVRWLRANGSKSSRKDKKINKWLTTYQVIKCS
jgi:hypothetical protein